jgi:hypothetical protein
MNANTAPAANTVPGAFGTRALTDIEVADLIARRRKVVFAVKVGDEIVTRTSPTMNYTHVVVVSDMLEKYRSEDYVEIDRTLSFHKSEVAARKAAQATGKYSPASAYRHAETREVHGYAATAKDWVEIAEATGEPAVAPPKASKPVVIECKPDSYGGPDEWISDTLF